MPINLRKGREFRNRERRKEWLAGFVFIVWAAVCGCTLCGCTSTAGTGGPQTGSGSQGTGPTGSSTITVLVTPPTANIRAGSTYSFTASVSGSSDTAVTWSVNGTAGGSAALGTISAAGMYAAPATLPSPNTVTVTATSAAKTSATASSTVTLLNATPVLSGISPTSVSTGAYSLTLTGSGFVNGAQVLVNGAAISTTFVSGGQLKASGNAASAGTYSVMVVNPDPGSSQSSALNLQVGGSQPASGCSQMSVGQGASLNGFVPFTTSSLWNTDISGTPVDANSAAIISHIGPSVGLHADFGSGLYSGSSIGIPYTVVDGSQPLIPVTYNAYGSESDAGPMPIPLNAPIEGYPNPGSGDRHVLVLDTNTCFLYELYSSYPQTTSWTAASGAVWDLLLDEQRPYTWTSADAAGLPIFPGLVRYDEASAGAINHAIRFTLQNSRAAFVLPATHWASSLTATNEAPMGMKLRLKASFDVSGYSAINQAILNAMKKYGLILADNGSSMYISGAPDSRWDNSDLHLLGNVTAADFDVVQMATIYTSSNIPSGAIPTITQFNASVSNVSAGTPVTLSWQVMGASYLVVSPDVGATRGTSVIVTPAVTTTYTLYAANAYGQSTATVTVTVH